MRWAGHVARVVGMRNAYKLLGRDHSEDLGVYGRLVLKVG